MNTKIIPANYGSIPHLSTSKLTQQADNKIEIGQELILTKKARDWKDLIIVTEKIDGTNVGILKKNNKIYALTRSGYTAESSPYHQHHLFNTYVKNNIFTFSIPEGWRICGEWCIQSHGTIYDISNECPFIVFDIFDEHNKRLPYLELFRICTKLGLNTVPLLHIGQPISIDNAIKLLGRGHWGYPDKPEGFVYRCERENKVEFLAKWVRADKEDGKYLADEIYNIGINIVRERYMI